MTKHSQVCNSPRLHQVGFCLAISIASGLSAAAELGLANAPLFLASGVQPNIYFIIDDSGSMGWETLYTKEATADLKLPSNKDGDSTVDVTPPIRKGDSGLRRKRLLQSCVGANALHYDPTKVYTPWIGQDSSDNSFTNQSVTAAKRSPYYGNSKTDLTAKDGDDNEAGYFPWIDIDGDGRLDVYVETEKNNKIDVFIDRNGNGTFDGWVDTNGDGKVGAKEVETELECPDYDLIRTQLTETDTEDFLSEWLIKVTDMSAQEQTNYANWYSYYRKRAWVAKRALSSIINDSTARMGITSIWGRNTEKVVNVDNISKPYNSTANSNKDQLMDSMFKIKADGYTPLRKALKSAGEYFMEAPGSGPILTKDEGGFCQQNFAILMTDGFWNKDSPQVGNQDKNTTSPFDGDKYADDYSDTLADVAMKYYKTDLQPSLPDDVPASKQDPDDELSNKDTNKAQHLVTYTVGFGVTGTLGEGLEPGESGWPGWPKPISNSASTIDDLRHAAYNGRGLFLNAKDPQALIDALNGAINDLEGRSASASAGSANTGSISSSTMLFQAEFNSKHWNGKINGIPVKLDGSLDLDNQAVASKVPVYGERTIVTYNGSKGIPFQWSELSAAQQALVKSQDIVAYTRGDRSKEGEEAGTLRQRTLMASVPANAPSPSPGPLGDIINSAPAYVGNPEFLYPDSLEGQYSEFRLDPDGDGLFKRIGNLLMYRTPVLYVGSNDGMLHAFNVDPTLKGTAAFGRELFAYVPTMALEHLPKIATNTNYRHAYSVDGSPAVADAFFDDSWHTVLTSGMNAGGQGIFALDVSNPNAFATEAGAAAKVLWEFTDADDPNLGYTFGKPTIAKANTGRWVAIFGNGYNNTVADGNVGSGTAVLYIVDLETGALIKKIDTDINLLSTPNGLSSPTTLDTDGDYRADAVYAGDLEGNMWKFDISSADPDQWGVAYSTGLTPTPLYTACTDPLCTTTNRQPITVKPQIGFNKGATGVLIYFGTGTYFLRNDNQNNGIQSFYAIWDKELSTLTAFNRRHLLKQEIIKELDNKEEVDTFRVTTKNPIYWHKTNDLPVDSPLDEDSVVDTHLGWYIDLVNTEDGNTDGHGERSVSNPMLRDGSVIFVTAIPNQVPCSYGGSSWYMELNAVTGSRHESAVIDFDGDGNVDGEDYVDTTVTDKIALSGKKSPDMATSPVCITLPNGAETCKSKTLKTGNFEVARDAGLLLGRWMWRELRANE